MRGKDTLNWPKIIEFSFFLKVLFERNLFIISEIDSQCIYSLRRPSYTKGVEVLCIHNPSRIPSVLDLLNSV